MRTKFVLACALAVGLASPSFAASYYVVQNTKTHKCTVAATKPSEKSKTMVLVGDGTLPRPWGLLTFASRPEPDRADDLNRVETRRESPAGFLPATAIRSIFSCPGSQIRALCRSGATRPVARSGCSPDWIKSKARAAIP